MTKISLLDPADPPTGTEQIPVVQGGVTKRMGMGELADAVAGGDAGPAIAAAIAAHEAEANPHPQYATDADLAAHAAAADPHPQYLTADELPYIWGFAMVGTATAGEVLNIHAIGRAFTLPADFGGGALETIKGVNPTAATVAVTLQRSTDGGETWTDVATITIASDGTVTGATAGHADIAFAKGNGLRPVAPSVADATFASWAFTIIGVNN